MKKSLAVFAVLLALFGGNLAFAHNDETGNTASYESSDTSHVGEFDLEQSIAKFSLRSSLIGFVAILFLIGIMALLKSPSDTVRALLFWPIIIIVTTVSLGLIGSTIYLNTNSSSGGPVHWHADLEIWGCGSQIELKNPTGMLSNKIGSATLHEHNDKRIHLEGVVVKPVDASVGKFFKVIGGSISDHTLAVPTDSGTQTYVSNQKCPGDNQNAEVQLFVFRANPDKTFSQTKAAHPAQHLIGHSSNVPPGDCLIIEFGPPKDKTERICRSYEVAQQIGDLKGAR
jgi:hypothetical protein